MATDQQLHARIRRAEPAREIEIGVDLRRLNRPDSPVFARWDNALPGFALVAAVLLAFVLGGWVWALAIAASGLILLATVVNLLVMTRLRTRALRMALADAEGWQRLWDLGGLTLRLPGRPESECAAPEDWRTLARRLSRRPQAEAAE